VFSADKFIIAENANRKVNEILTHNGKFFAAWLLR